MILIVIVIITVIVIMTVLGVTVVIVVFTVSVVITFIVVFTVNVVITFIVIITVIIVIMVIIVIVVPLTVTIFLDKLYCAVRMFVSNILYNTNRNVLNQNYLDFFLLYFLVKMYLMCHVLSVCYYLFIEIIDIRPSDLILDLLT